MAGTVRYSTVLKQVARVVSAAADDESYWPMRRAVQCEYRTVPYGGGVSLLLSYLLLVYSCVAHSFRDKD